MRKILLLLCVFLVITVAGCAYRTNSNLQANKVKTFPDENKIKSDLIGKTLRLNDEDQWSFDALSEFNSFEITDTQKTDKSAEFTIGSCLQNLNDNQKFWAEYVCAYRLDETDTWVFANLFGKKYNKINSDGKMFSSQSQALIEGENTIDEGNLYQWDGFEITEEMQNAKLIGNFETQNKEGVALFLGNEDLDGDLRRRVSQAKNVIYKSGLMTSDKVDLKLKPGKYVLGFYNPSYESKGINVKSNIGITYDVYLGTNYKCR